MEDVATHLTQSLHEKDLPVLKDIIETALGGQEAPSLRQAAEAVLSVLAEDGCSEGVPLDTQPATSSRPTPAQEGSLGIGLSTAELAAQVAASVRRVSALRQNMVAKIQEGLSTQLQNQRPTLNAGDPSVQPSVLPGSASMKDSTGAARQQACAAADISFRLIQTVDKLPALRARMIEVNRRMENVVTAVAQKDEYTMTIDLQRATPLRRNNDNGLLGAVGRSMWQA